MAVSALISTGLETVTVTPGSTAPEVSATRPEMSPTSDCAHPDVAAQSNATTVRKAVKRPFMYTSSWDKRLILQDGRAGEAGELPSPTPILQAQEEHGACHARSVTARGHFSVF